VCIEVQEQQAAPIDPDPAQVQSVAAAVQSAAARKYHNGVTRFLDQLPEDDPKRMAIQHVVNTIYDMNIVSFRQQCRKDSVRLAMYIFSVYAAIPSCLYNNPGQFVEFFHKYRTFSHDDRLRLPSNTKFASFKNGKLCREVLDSDDFASLETSGKRLLDIVPEKNLVVRQTGKLLSDSRSFDFEDNNRVFIKSAIELDSDTSASHCDALVSNCPHGPFFAATFSPQPPAISEEPKALTCHGDPTEPDDNAIKKVEVCYDVDTFDVTDISDRTIYFKDA
jgi:hypothetical protein